MKKLISICGSDVGDQKLTSHALDVAERVGGLIAKKDGILICGGHGGIMEAACKGCKQKNGLTVGILPYKKDEANPYVDIAIPTGIGNVRNFMVVQAGDAVIAIGGRWGTLNEISFSMISKKPLVLIKNTGGCVDKIIESEMLKNVESKYYIAKTAEEAVNKVFELI